MASTAFRPTVEKRPRLVEVPQLTRAWASSLPLPRHDSIGDTVSIGWSQYWSQTPMIEPINARLQHPEKPTANTGVGCWWTQVNSM